MTITHVNEEMSVMDDVFSFPKAPGSLLRSDDELQWAIDNEIIVEIVMLNIPEDVDVMVNFNPYLIQMPGNKFFHRDDVQVYISSPDL